LSSTFFRTFVAGSNRTDLEAVERARGPRSPAGGGTSLNQAINLRDVGVVERSKEFGLALEPREAFPQWPESIVETA
jgi:hypothetical protein